MSSSKLITSSLLFLIAHALLPSGASACSPTGQTFAEIVEQSPLIVTGYIESVEYDDGGVNNPAHYRVRVRVYSYWKDEAGSFSPIITVRDDAGTCSLQVTEGETWLIVTWSISNEMPTTGLFSGSSHVDSVPAHYWSTLGPPLVVPVSNASWASMKAGF